MDAQSKRPFIEEMFSTACDLLNGDAPIPQATAPEGAPPPRAGDAEGILRQAGIAPPPYLRSVTSLSSLSQIWVPDAPWGGRLRYWTRLGQGPASETGKARRALVRELAPEGLGREDALRLADFLRTHYRYYLLSPLKEHRHYWQCVLPLVRGGWPPRPTPEQWKAEWEWVRPRLEGFDRFSSKVREWFGGDTYLRLLLVSLVKRPKTYEDAYLCLLAAFVSSFSIPGRDARVIRPCFACCRFFVAVSPKRLTCSDQCRQRYSRAIRPDKRAARDKDAARKARKRAQARTAGQPGRKTPTRTSRTSRRAQ